VSISWARGNPIFVLNVSNGGQSGKANGKPPVSLPTSAGLVQSGGSAIGEISIFFRVE